MKTPKLLSLLLALLGALAPAGAARAADHLDPPTRAPLGDAADITDIYAWHKGAGADQRLVLVVNVGGPVAPGVSASYDRDVLYTLHLDTTGDNVADSSVYVRFAQNLAGEWGVQVTGLPGAIGPIVGPANQTLEVGAVKVFTGLRDDPFFFDLQGFQETLMTGALSFSRTRDFFAGQNVTSLVFEVPMSAALGVGNSISFWATSARIGG